MWLCRSILLTLLIILTGCSTVTIQPKPIGNLHDAPTFETTRPFYFFGLIGEHRVDVKEICQEKTVLQMQTQQTAIDFIFLYFTFGIYTPHTIRVWCEV